MHQPACIRLSGRGLAWFSWLLNRSESIRVGIQRELFLVLPIAPRTANRASSLADQCRDQLDKRSAGHRLLRMARSRGTIVSVEVRGEIPKMRIGIFQTFQPISAGMSRTKRLLIPV